MDGLIMEGTGFWNKVGQVLGTEHSCLEGNMSAGKMLTTCNVIDSDNKRLSLSLTVLESNVWAHRI